MTIIKLDLGSIPNGFGGDNQRTGFEKVNQNFEDKNNAASRTVGIMNDQLPTNADVKKLTVKSKRTYKTLAKAIEDIPNVPVGAMVEVIEDDNIDNIRVFDYNGVSLVPTLRSPIYAVAQTVAGISVAFSDAQGNRTWLEANDEDGGPTPIAIQAIQDKLVFPEQTLGDIPFSYVDQNPLMYAVIDAEKNLTDLQLNEYGQIPDLVLTDWYFRMIALSGGGVTPPALPPNSSNAAKLDLKHFMPEMISTTININAQDTYYKNGELLPVMPDVNKVVYIGSSSAQKSAGYVETALKAINPSVRVYAPAYPGATIEAQEIWVGSEPLRVQVTGGLIKKTGATLITPNFDLSKSAYINNIAGWIEGIKGSISVSGGSFYFTRAASAATDTPVSGLVSFIPQLGNEYRNAVQLLWLGKNNLTSTDNSVNSVDSLMDKTDKIIDYGASLIKRTIIMTHYADTDEPAISAVRDRINRCNNLYKLRYRNNVFDAESIILGSQIFTDLGITRTQADINAQSIGNLPPSLAADRVHATNAVYQYIAQKLASFIQARNYLGK